MEFYKEKSKYLSFEAYQLIAAENGCDCPLCYEQFQNYYSFCFIHDFVPFGYESGLSIGECYFKYARRASKSVIAW